MDRESETLGMKIVAYYDLLKRRREDHRLDTQTRRVILD